MRMAGVRGPSVAILFVLAVGTFASGTDAVVIAGILPQISGSFGLTAGVVGLLLPAFAVTYAVVSPVLASAGEVDRRWSMLAGMAAFVVANAVAALAGAFSVLVLARVMAAAGAGLYVPMAAATAADLVPGERRGRALAAVLSGGTAAAVVGVPAGTLAGARFGWRAVFWLVAVAGCVSLVGLAVVGPRGHATPQPLRVRLRPLRDPLVTLVLGTTALAFAGEFSVYAYLGVIAFRQTGLGFGGLALLLFFFGTGGVIGNWLSGVLTDRLGARPILMTALVTLTAVLAAFPLLDRSPAGIFAASALLGAAAWMITAPQQHRLLALAPQTPGTVLALNQSALYLGIGLAGPLGALGLKVAGGRLEGLLAAAFVLAALSLPALEQGRRA